jgi:ribose transport system substrate-binding protein
MPASLDRDYRLSRRAAVTITLAGIGTALGIHASPGQQASAQEQDLTIVLIPGEGGANFFYVPMTCGAQAAADALGVTLQVEGAAYWDSDLQTALLNQVVATQPDAILIVPTDRTAMIAPIQAAVDAGIAVFTLDTVVDSEEPLATIASDNVEGGRIAARTLAAAIGERGKVFVINVWPGISSTDDREVGFAEEIARYPDIDYLGQAYSEGDYDLAVSLVADKLQQELDLAGIFATNADAAVGVAAAVADADAADRVAVVGFDAGPEQVEQLHAGSAAALIAQHPAEMGSAGVRLAVAYLRSGEAPADRQVSTGFTVVTRDTLNDPSVPPNLYGLECSQEPLASPIAT